MGGEPHGVDNRLESEEFPRREPAVRRPDHLKCIDIHLLEAIRIPTILILPVEYAL